MIYRLYIGSNNNTHRLESAKALRLVSARFKGFTSYKAQGYWQGSKENTLIIEIEATSQSKVKQLAKELAKELKQQAIGFLKLQSSMQFIS